MSKAISVVISGLMLVVSMTFLSNSLLGQTARVEVGLVNWNRDLEAAKTLSAKSGKPLFVQFQEVPG